MEKILVTTDENEILKEISVQLKRIADALEKQNAGEFVPMDSNGISKNGPSQRRSDEVSRDPVVNGIKQRVRNAVARGV